MYFLARSDAGGFSFLAWSARRKASHANTTGPPQRTSDIELFVGGVILVELLCEINEYEFLILAAAAS